MSEYQLSHEAWVYRRADDAKIVPPLSGLPEDVGSPGWTEYQQWLADGNTPDPADPLPPAPIPSASAWQVRKALNLLGWRDDVEAYVAQADITVKDGWLTARDYFRDDPFVVGVGQLLGKTDAELDDLFRLAATL